ncbi:MAG: hypothetical protein KJ755_21125 [Alphaproteobacteria bacterium]|nr:hypothetical protein [Gammaproteobacteria bacterium]MBU0852230.1 hypothetical protein [Gammaproteobacteria bacterium]MBU1461714.1 hypothetical protein [Gammaproteobacteria bacterium]MBU1772777.1 hypothetical protein [Gammaproteobacteria bacterium]MBU2329828.1 hypothetical protein [Alphaproteobacteria bacterium]|tara:strand:- start:4386 stop:5054 length:669 start_codon:yes stop_codon:yes gene_type:complete
MTATARNIDEVEVSLDARRQALELRQEQLEGEHEAAALAAAEGDDNATKRVPAIKQELRELQDELTALDAACRALDRRKHDQRINERVADVKAAEQAIPGSCRSLQAAWAKLESAFAEVGAAWADVKEVAQTTNAHARACQQPGVMRNRVEMRNDIALDALSNLAGKLLFIATQDEIEPNGVRYGNSPVVPEEVRERINTILEAIQRNAVMHSARSVKAIRE